MGSSIASCCSTDSTDEICNNVNADDNDCDPCDDTPPQPVWHEHHQDPCADVILQTNDGVLHTASSWRLARASSVFNDMLQDYITPGMTPISIDCKSFTLAIFLDLVSVQHPFTPQCNVNVTKQLLQLCDLFECPEIATAVLSRLRYLASAQPWDVLVAASEVDNVGLAKDVLRGLASCTVQKQVRRLDTLSTFWEDVLVKLRPTWQVKLLALIFLTARDVPCNGGDPRGDRKMRCIILNLNWEGIATAFNP